MQKSYRITSFSFCLLSILFVSCDSKTETTIPVLTTTAISSISTIAATSGGTITFDSGSSITGRGVCWSTKTKPTIADSKTNDSIGTGSFTSSITGLKGGTIYFVRAYATNSLGTVYGNEVQFTTLNVFNPNLNYGSVNDIDGNVYKTIKIGTLTWMAENLRTTKYNDGTAIPLIKDSNKWIFLEEGAYCWCNNDSTAKYNSYGAWYNWYAVNTGKLAPVGWHVATNSEWATLKSYVSANLGTSKSVVNALVSSIEWPDSPLTGDAGNNRTFNNYSGFSALPGGYRDRSGESVCYKNYGIWMTSDNYSASAKSAPYTWAIFGTGVLNASDQGPFGMSVRCVKD